MEDVPSPRAERTVFRGASGGRFVSRATAEAEGGFRLTIADGGVVDTTVINVGGAEEPPLPTHEPNWAATPTKWGDTWSAGGVPLDLDALSVSEPPEGMKAFRVRYTVEDNPDYPRGYASSDWFTPDQWGSDLMLNGPDGATGIAMIHFESE